MPRTKIKSQSKFIEISTNYVTEGNVEIQAHLREEDDLISQALRYFRV